MIDQLSLRPLAVDDAEAMTVVLRDPSLYAFIGGEPPTVEQLRRRYEIQTRGGTADGTQRWVNAIVVVDGQSVGYVQATIPTGGGPTEIAWVIGRPWQGRGYAARAARQLVDGLEAEGVTEFVAHIHPDHAASNRIATGLGMVATDVVIDGEVEWRGSTSRP